MLDTGAGERFRETWHSPAGLMSRWSAVNNQPIGRRFMMTAFVFFLIGGVMALLMRVQLAVPRNDFLSPDIYNQLFTMHGSTMMYLFVVPFIEGLALYLIPLMVGSRDVAYPRLSAFGYWMYLFGGVLFYLSFLSGAAPDAGWFAYTPLSGARYSGIALDFWLLGLSMVEVSGIVAGIEIAVTILKFRAPGMALQRMPVFAWAMLVTGIMIIFAFTTLLVATILLELDRTASTRFFDAEHGGSSLLWQHLFWFFGHPEVYISFIPATGIVSMIVPVFARRPLAAHTLVVVAIIVTGFVSFGLWVHHMYTTGIPTLAMNFFAAASLMIALASGTQIFAWIATLWRTRPGLQAPLLYVLGFVFIFVLGGMTGVMVAVVPFDWQVHDTFFVVAHFHYVLIGGVVLPIFAAIYYWFPKMTGRRLGGGKLSFWLVFIGFNVTFFPMHIMGLLGMPRRTYTYVPELQLGGYNMASTIGSGVLAMGVLVVILAVVAALLRRRSGEPDPWGGDTLEWSLGSPPPNYGFEMPPRVGSLTPVWAEGDQLSEPAGSLQARLAMNQRPQLWRATLVTDAVDAEPQAIQSLPGPTFVPLYASAAVLLAAIGVLFSLYVLAVFGVLAFLTALVSWFKVDPQRLKLIRNDRVAADAGLSVFPTGPQSVGWWGWIAYAACASTAAGVLAYSYFYLRLYSPAWPQGGIAAPQLGASSLAFGGLAAAMIPAWLSGRWFRARRPELSVAAQLAALAAGLGFVALQTWMFTRLGFSVSQNAYASIFVIAGAAVMVQTAVSMGCSIGMLTRMREEARDVHGPLALGVQITANMWYLTAALAIAFYAMLYLSPLLLGDGG